MNAFDLAAANIGLNETGKKAALQDYLTTGGANLDPATTAWCAAFVNATLQQSGGTGTGSNMARSFMEWGTGVSEPQRGDLAVFSRGDPNGPFGHVGFFDGYNQDGTIRVLGGNQGDAVGYANYSKADLLGFRRGDMPAQPGANALAQQGSQPETPPPFMMQTAQLDPADFTRQRNPLAPVSLNYERRNILGQI